VKLQQAYISEAVAIGNWGVIGYKGPGDNTNASGNGAATSATNNFTYTDASGWSMTISFEGGSIDSGGYATGPDHHDTLNKILQYLVEVAGIEEE
jgi:hypothetical protein